MVCWFYQWSAESTKMIEPLKICHQIGDGLLNLPMVCWVYKYDWTIVNEWFDVLWSVQSTNGLESLQEWKDEKICNGLLSLQMVCQTTQKSTSVALRSLQKMVCVDWFQMVCSVTNALLKGHFNVRIYRGKETSFRFYASLLSAYLLIFFCLFFFS